MKIISKETGVSIALVMSMIGGAIYITMSYASMKAEISVIKDESSAIKQQILTHEKTDKEVLTKINTEHVTKTEVDLGTKVIETKLDAIAKDVREIKEIIRTR